jgi:hypothetical protein
MSGLRIYKTFALFISIALLVSACGSSQQSAVATSVVQTVQAGESLTQIARLEAAAPSNTPGVPGAQTPLAPAFTPTSAATLAPAPADPNCAKASLVSENPPDQTILTPGEYFWKTWTLQNTGTCTWTTAYQLVFWSGDRLGSSISYALPDDVAPGETKDITIYLQAPDTGGSFTGFWRMKTPWASNFGVGQYDASISTSIVVGSLTPESHKTETIFGITSVTYTIERTCTAANTIYAITAFITSDGPLKIDFQWIQSDGNSDMKNSLTFTEAATKTVTREWSQHKDSAPSSRWIQVIVTSPTYREFDKVPLPDFCSFKP